MVSRTGLGLGRGNAGAGSVPGAVHENTGLKVWRNSLLLDFFARLSSIQSPENRSQDLNDYLSSSNRCRIQSTQYLSIIGLYIVLNTLVELIEGVSL